MYYELLIDENLGITPTSAMGAPYYCKNFNDVLTCKKLIEKYGYAEFETLIKYNNLDDIK